MDLTKTLTKLMELGLCKSGYDFSVNYLGKAPSYFSMLKACNADPSIEAVATMQYVLANKVSVLQGVNSPSAAKQREQLMELANTAAAGKEALCSAQLANSRLRYKSHSFSAKTR